MTTIKLNNYYPHLTECVTLEVSEEIAVTLSIGGRQCDSYKRRKREHNECSLDADPGLARFSFTHQSLSSILPIYLDSTTS